MSNVTVTIQFASIDEAISFLSRDKATDQNQMPLPLAAPVADAPKETKPRGRKATKTQPEVVENTGSGASPVAADPVADAAGEATGGVASLDDVRAALAIVNEKKGLLFARELVAKFQNAKGEPCGRVSEIQEADWAVAVAACHKAVA